jgi:hypothetical protein
LDQSEDGQASIWGDGKLKFHLSGKSTCFVVHITLEKPSSRQQGIFLILINNEEFNIDPSAGREFCSAH